MGQLNLKLTSHKLSTIIYAQGFIGEHIETHNNFLDERETDEYRSEVQDMWRLLSEGVDQLMRENASLRNKLTLIDLARNTQT